MYPANSSNIFNKSQHHARCILRSQWTHEFFQVTCRPQESPHPYRNKCECDKDSTNDKKSENMQDYISSMSATFCHDEASREPMCQGSMTKSSSSESVHQSTALFSFWLSNQFVVFCLRKCVFTGGARGATRSVLSQVSNMWLVTILNAHKAA